MTDQPTPSIPDSSGPQTSRRSPSGTPRWVKVLVLIFIGLVLFVVILHLTGNSFGGPGGHVPQMP